MQLKIGSVLVLLMVILQGFYSIFAYIDPIGFSVLRGTDLNIASDSDWVVIYASRTLFVSLVVGILLYFRNFKILIWVALIGTVMPITDALLAYQAGAVPKVVIKHIVTIIYLAITAFLLFNATKQNKA